MTDIVEQAARVIDKAMAANIYKRFDPATGPSFGESIAQALADAGLLAAPVRTLPTRDEIADAVMERDEIDVDYLDRDSALKYADAVLELLDDEVVLKGSAQEIREEQ